MGGVKFIAFTEAGARVQIDGEEVMFPWERMTPELIKRKSYATKEKEYLVAIRIREINLSVLLGEETYRTATAAEEACKRAREIALKPKETKIVAPAEVK